MSRIARNSANGRLNRNTFYSSAEVVPVQCKRCVSLSCKCNTYNDVLLINYCSSHQFRNWKPSGGGGRPWPWSWPLPPAKRCGGELFFLFFSM